MTKEGVASLRAARAARATAVATIRRGGAVSSSVRRGFGLPSRDVTAKATPLKTKPIYFYNPQTKRYTYRTDGSSPSGRWQRLGTTQPAGYIGGQVRGVATAVDKRLAKLRGGSRAQQLTREGAYYYQPITGAITRQKISGQKPMTKQEARYMKEKYISKGFSPFFTKDGRQLTKKEHKRIYEKELRAKKLARSISHMKPKTVNTEHGTMTVTPQGDVIERDKQGNITSRYKAEMTSVVAFFKKELVTIYVDKTKKKDLTYKADVSRPTPLWTKKTRFGKEYDVVEITPKWLRDIASRKEQKAEKQKGTKQITTAMGAAALSGLGTYISIMTSPIQTAKEMVSFVNAFRKDLFGTGALIGQELRRRPVSMIADIVASAAGFRTWGVALKPVKTFTKAKLKKLVKTFKKTGTKLKVATNKKTGTKTIVAKGEFINKAGKKTRYDSRLVIVRGKKASFTLRIKTPGGRLIKMTKSLSAAETSMLVDVLKARKIIKVDAKPILKKPLRQLLSIKEKSISKNIKKYSFKDIRTGKVRYFNSRRVWLKGIKQQAKFLDTIKGRRFLRAIKKKQTRPKRVSIEKQRRLLRKQQAIEKKLAEGKRIKAVRIDGVMRGGKRVFPFRDIVTGKLRYFTSRKVWLKALKKQVKFLNSVKGKRFLRRTQLKITRPTKIDVKKIVRTGGVIRNGKRVYPFRDIRTGRTTYIVSRKQWLRSVKQQARFLDTVKGKRLLRKIKKQQTRPRRLELEKQRRLLRKQQAIEKKIVERKQIKAVRTEGVIRGGKRVYPFKDIRSGKIRYLVSRKVWLRAVKQQNKFLSSIKGKRFLRRIKLKRTRTIRVNLEKQRRLLRKQQALEKKLAQGKQIKAVRIDGVMRGGKRVYPFRDIKTGQLRYFNSRKIWVKALKQQVRLIKPSKSDFGRFFRGQSAVQLLREKGVVFFEYKGKVLPKVRKVTPFSKKLIKKPTRKIVSPTSREIKSGRLVLIQKIKPLKQKLNKLDQKIKIGNTQKTKLLLKVKQLPEPKTLSQLMSPKTKLSTYSVMEQLQLQSPQLRLRTQLLTELMSLKSLILQKSDLGGLLSTYQYNIIKSKLGFLTILKQKQIVIQQLKQISLQKQKMKQVLVLKLVQIQRLITKQKQILKQIQKIMLLQKSKLLLKKVKKLKIKKFVKVDLDKKRYKKLMFLLDRAVKSNKFIYLSDIYSRIYGIKAKKIERKELLRKGRIFTGMEIRRMVG